MPVSVRIVPGMVVVLALGAGAGCRNAAPTAAGAEKLAGTVRLDGKIVNYGSVTFHSETGQPLKAIIELDGTYRIRKPPVGEVKVVVQTGPAPKVIGAPGGKSPPPIVLETIKLPAKYTNVETTDLRYVVTSSESEYHIEMKSTPTADKP